MKKAIVGLIVAAFLVGVCGAVEAQQQQFKWKLQSANPAGTPHMEILNKFAANVDKMSAGRLKIEVLPSGAIVNPFEILDAVNKGVIDSGQWWTHYATGKHPAGGLFSAPLGGAGSGLDMFNHLSWYLRGEGRGLYLEYYQKIIKADVMAFLIAPDGPEAFGWYKNAAQDGRGVPQDAGADVLRPALGRPEGHGRHPGEHGGTGNHPRRGAGADRRRGVDQHGQRSEARAL